MRGTRTLRSAYIELSSSARQRRDASSRPQSMRASTASKPRSSSTPVLRQSQNSKRPRSTTQTGSAASAWKNVWRWGRSFYRLSPTGTRSVPKASPVTICRSRKRRRRTSSSRRRRIRQSPAAYRTYARLPERRSMATPADNARTRSRPGSRWRAPPTDHEGSRAQGKAAGGAVRPPLQLLTPAASATAPGYARQRMRSRRCQPRAVHARIPATEAWPAILTSVGEIDPLGTRQDSLDAFLDQKVEEGYAIETRTDTHAIVSRRPKGLKRFMSGADPGRYVVEVDEDGIATMRPAEPRRA